MKQFQWFAENEVETNGFLQFEENKVETKISAGNFTGKVDPNTLAGLQQKILQAMFSDPNHFVKCSPSLFGFNCGLKHYLDCELDQMPPPTNYPRIFGIK